MNEVTKVYEDIKLQRGMEVHRQIQERKLQKI